MSREERKMAQIIASIERMEQEARASGDDSNRTQDANDLLRQGGRGRKSKKGKIVGFKTKPGKKLTVTAVGGGARTPFERKLTPKKRWIQLWNAQLDTLKEKDASSSSDEPDAEVENETSAVATSPVSEVKVTPAAPPAPLVIDEPMVKVPEIPENVTENKSQEMSTQQQITEPLRVKTPLNNESSHLSPPLERNSPTTTASISPSAKVKDSDTPNNNTAAAAAAAAKFPPAASEQDKPVTEKKELSRRDSAPRLERKSSSSSSVGKGEDSCRRDTSERYQDRGRKRSLEITEQLPMSEEAKRRAERRRKRRSNWDVGDPRKGGSPVADPPVSAAAAAANQQSFAKYPSNRPSWRHSQSMMDMKPQFQSGHRPSSFYNNGPSSSSGSRRGFYHSSSLPQDRSRSAGRSSSTRYSYGKSSNSGNYR
ncbi:uncharacterized protein PITG_16433 [Phytophthora infestans T30-4]|uniref:Uncharacterized protein n=1 Tax=Phytophthora infestans (strain T30-4) TaxID=403677 RepID=D0NTM3_PHYIT|nr:uncharacterized protein PITG_16433 [Phytophthora infestans T30-4]EEY64985.1 conserved hypothetical protein [Phytophthora infestans T30-4]|eukprot:XP_002897473.1 conserved hypothetical protein [Phytophthora infestans T30-4]